MTDEDLYRHLWSSYQSTINGRQANGDVALLAEAAERMEWPGAPEMGLTIARVLRAKVVKGKTGRAANFARVVRDREIVKLAQIHAEQGMTQKDSYECIARYYKMTVDAVRQQVARKDLNK
jgi:hypothetical protein